MRTWIIHETRNISTPWITQSASAKRLAFVHRHMPSTRRTRPWRSTLKHVRPELDKCIVLRWPVPLLLLSVTGSANFDTARYGGLGLLKCAADYLLLDGIRYCGIHLNSMSSVTQTGSETDMPVIDRGNGPFIARFVSNERYVGRGFRIAFQQNPCGSRIPGAITNYEQISSNG